MTGTDPFATFDAAYVLDALSDDERRAFEAHLSECDSCAASVRELGDLPDLLATVSADALAGEPPPASLLPALQFRVHRERRRRRWIAGGLVAAAAACVIGVTVALTTGDSGPARHPVAMRTVVDVPIQATADLRDVAWGTRIELVCRYYEGTPPARPYALVVVDRKGQSHQLGSWMLESGHVTTYETGTALRRADIAEVDITTISGTRLLTLPL